MKQLANALDDLGFSVRSLARARNSRQQREAEQLEFQLKQVLPSDAASRIALAYASLAPDPNAENWTFVMISPAQNSAVVSWLLANSKRRTEAVQLWALLFTAMRNDTGEVMLTRAQMAERVGMELQNVSRIMTELESINAIRREKSGRAIRYFMSAQIATHVATPAARAEARKKSGPLQLVLISDGAPG
jgi:CRP-like cAMP-binding protein